MLPLSLVQAMPASHSTPITTRIILNTLMQEFLTHSTDPNEGALTPFNAT